LLGSRLSSTLGKEVIVKKALNFAFAVELETIA